MHYDQGAREQIASLYERVTQLEKLVQYPNTYQSEMQQLYAPLRSDTRAVVDLAAFARRLVDMQDLGHAVTEEVRQLAMRALGLK
jgi:hypothetical protein